MLASFKIIMKTLKQPIPAKEFLHHAIVCQKNHQNIADSLFPNASVHFKMAINHYAAMQVAEHEAKQWEEHDKRSKKT